MVSPNATETDLLHAYVLRTLQNNRLAKLTDEELAEALMDEFNRAFRKEPPYAGISTALRARARARKHPGLIRTLGIAKLERQHSVEVSVPNAASFRSMLSAYGIRTGRRFITQRCSGGKLLVLRID